MKFLNEKLIIRFSYLYISVPFLIFITTWLKWYYAFIFAVLLLVSLFFSVKENNISLAGNFRLRASPTKILFAATLILLWLFFSGIGSYSYQTDDHHWRNAVFADLIKSDWPVIYHVDGLAQTHPLQGKTCLLSYYVAFWLPAALVGKVFGFTAANIFLFIWSACGLLLLFYFICRFLNSFSLSRLLIFIFWGTAYSVGLLIKYNPEFLIKNEHVLWAGYMFYADNNTGLLYWVFNQSLVPWLIIMLLLNNMRDKNIFFLYSFCAFHGPLAFVGLFPFVIFKFIKSFRHSKISDKNMLAHFKKFLSFQNVVGSLCILSVTFLYFSVNSAKERFVIVLPDPMLYFYFIFLSFGLICILLFSRFKREPLLYISAGLLAILPFMRLGTGLDFCARVSIPAMFVLMLLVMRYMAEEKNKIKRLVVIIYLVIGSVLPVLQITRSMALTFVQNAARANWDLPVNDKNVAKKMEQAKYKNILLKDGFGTLSSPKNEVMRNFMGDTTNRFFCRELMKIND